MKLNLNQVQLFCLAKDKSGRRLDSQSIQRQELRLSMAKQVFAVQAREGGLAAIHTLLSA